MGPEVLGILNMCILEIVSSSDISTSTNIFFTLFVKGILGRRIGPLRKIDHHLIIFSEPLIILKDPGPVKWFEFVEPRSLWYHMIDRF